MIIYLTVINVISFVLMIIDKYNAIKNKSRIPNRLLYLLGICGGFIGISLGIILINHKTTKINYYLAIGMGIILWLGIIIYMESM